MSKKLTIEEIRESGGEGVEYLEDLHIKVISGYIKANGDFLTLDEIKEAVDGYYENFPALGDDMKKVDRFYELQREIKERGDIENRGENTDEELSAEELQTRFQELNAEMGAQDPEMIKERDEEEIRKALQSGNGGPGTTDSILELEIVPKFVNTYSGLLALSFSGYKLFPGLSEAINARLQEYKQEFAELKTELEGEDEEQNPEKHIEDGEEVGEK